MSIEGRLEKLKIGGEKPKEELGEKPAEEIKIEIEGKKIEEKNFVEDVKLLFSEAGKVLKDKLPSWLENLVKKEEKPIIEEKEPIIEEKEPIIEEEKPIIKIKKSDFAENVYFKLPGNITIKISVRSLEKPSKVDIKISKKEKEIILHCLEGKLAKEIIKKTKIIGMADWGGKITLKEGNKNIGFIHIKKKHFEKFNKLGIQTKEQLKRLIIRSIEKTKNVEHKKNKEVYLYKDKDEKGNFLIRTVVDSRTGSIITSYPVDSIEKLHPLGE